MAPTSARGVRRCSSRPTSSARHRTTASSRSSSSPVRRHHYGARLHWFTDDLGYRQVGDGPGFSATHAFDIEPARSYHPSDGHVALPALLDSPGGGVEVLGLPSVDDRLLDLQALP